MSTPCKYGAKCYRKNPDHLKQFSHPPKDGSGPPSPEKKKRSPLNINNIRLGIPSTVWAYRKEGRARLFDLESTVPEDFENPENGRMLLSQVSLELLEQLKKDGVQHGDVLSFNSYRGCGAFIAEPVDLLKSDFWLHKTVEEMGYGMPLLFSDAPRLVIYIFCLFF